MEAFIIPMILLAGISGAGEDNASIGAKVQVQASARIIEAEIIPLNARMFDGKARVLSENQSPVRSYTIHTKENETELRLTEFH